MKLLVPKMRVILLTSWTRLPSQEGICCVESDHCCPKRFSTQYKNMSKAGPIGLSKVLAEVLLNETWGKESNSINVKRRTGAALGERKGDYRSECCWQNIEKMWIVGGPHPLVAELWRIIRTHAELRCACGSGQFSFQPCIPAPATLRLRGWVRMQKETSL